jgi:murein DD-endopeptidase MepM/ murein hydrolase activator NlpD
MKFKSYTFFVASNTHGKLSKMRIPFYVLQLLLVLAVVGGATVVAGVASYGRMLWKAVNYNQVRGERDSLKQQYQELQAMVKESNQRLNSLQSLATEVAMTYGIIRFRRTPFDVSEAPVASEEAFQRSVEQFDYLRRNATSVAIASQGLHLMPGRNLEDLTFTPSLWPVMGRITGSFGERLDPFSGEGAFHAGVDISSEYGDDVRSAADGLVVAVEQRAGYGRMILVDHGFGTSTLYGHLSGYKTRVGARVKRGETIGTVGTSGRASGPHVHYEVRIYGTPVNPWRYLRSSSAAD